jgi:hypothetical protein
MKIIKNKVVKYFSKSFYFSRKSFGEIFHKKVSRIILQK